MSSLLLLVSVMLTSILLFTYILQTIFLTDRRMNRRMKRFLELKDRGKLNLKKWNLLVDYRIHKQRMRQNLRSRKGGLELQRKLERAGIPLSTEEFVLFHWMAIALTGGFFLLITGELWFIPIGMLIGFLMPKWWVSKKQKERLDKFNEELPDLIATLVGSLRAGFSFIQSLKSAAEEMRSPIKEEIETVITEMQYGSQFEDSLNELKERMPSEDLELLIQAVVIQKQVGGNLAEILDKIVETIRERNRIHRQIKSLTAQGRLSGMVIGFLPPILGIILYLIEPDYISTLFQHPVGIAMLVAGVIGGVLGFFSIRKITSIEGVTMLYLTFFCTIILIVYAVFSFFNEKKEAVKRRMESFLAEERQSVVPEPAEEKRSRFAFIGKIWTPFWKEFKRGFKKRLPGEKEAKIEIRLYQAGSPFGMGPVEFRIFQLSLFFLLPLLFGSYGVVLNIHAGGTTLLVVIAFIVAAALPHLYLHLKTKQRNMLAVRELPDVLDLLTVSLEAGLGFDSALSKLVSKKDGVLSQEFQRCLEEIRLGKTRKEALYGVKERLVAEEVRTLISSIIQAEKLGIGLVQVLRIQSREMRDQRRQRAEEEAMKAPVKMLFPLVLFIFPSLFIILLGPAVIQFITTFSK